MDTNALFCEAREAGMWDGAAESTGARVQILPQYTASIEDATKHASVMWRHSMGLLAMAAIGGARGLRMVLLWGTGEVCGWYVRLERIVEGERSRRLSSGGLCNVGAHEV